MEAQANSQAARDPMQNERQHDAFPGERPWAKQGPDMHEAQPKDHSPGKPCAIFRSHGEIWLALLNVPFSHSLGLLFRGRIGYRWHPVTSFDKIDSLVQCEPAL